MATVQWSFSTKSSLYRWNHYLLASTPNATDGASDYEFYNFADKVNSIPDYSKINSVIFWTQMKASAGKNEGYVKINGSGGTKFCEGSGGTDWFNLNAVNGFPYVNGDTSQINLVSYCHSMTQDAGWLPNLYYYVSRQGSAGVARNFSIELTITWDYTPPQFTVNVSAGEGGTASGGGTTACGGSRTITATANTGYEFIGWSDGVKDNPRTITCGSPTQFQTTYNLTAQFKKLTYTVIWKNHDGTTLETDSNVEYGTTPSYNGATPTKASTAQHIYTFSGWSPTVSAVTGNVTYTAQFTATVRKYTVKWYNYDGTLLETDTDVPYGTKPTYNGATPTRPSDDYYTYGFAGWSPSTDEAIQGDKNFTTQFAQVDRYYIIRWVNASAEQGVEGALLETDEVKFNTQPDYNGATPKHPKQDSDPAFNYDFIGWSAKVTDPAKPDTELEKVKGNITYTAIYETTPKLYAVTVILFDSQSTDIYEYGKEITIEAPAVTGYQFIKWTDGNTDNPRTVKVTGEATYQAVYEVSKHTLKLSYRENEGTISGAENGTYEYGTAFTITASPKTGYKFLYWVVASGDGTETTYTDNPIQVTVYGDITLGAVFESVKPPEITLVQMLYQNKQISATNRVPTEEYFRIVVGANFFS